MATKDQKKLKMKENSQNLTTEKLFKFIHKVYLFCLYSDAGTIKTISFHKTCSQALRSAVQEIWQVGVVIQKPGPSIYHPHSMDHRTYVPGRPSELFFYFQTGNDFIFLSGAFPVNSWI